MTEPITQTPEYQALQQQLLEAREDILRLKEELFDAQHSYKSLFENAGDSIFIVDIASYMILDLNGHAARRLGYTREELLGHSLDDIEVHDENADLMQVAWVSKISSTHVYECHHRHKDGHLIPVEVSSRIIKMVGRDCVLNFVRNIEARKQLEAEREQLIDDLDSFAHTVAHDIKSPLSTVFGYACLLTDIAGEVSLDELKEYLQSIANNSQRIVHIVNELLLFASVRKQDEIERSALDMSAIMHEVNERLASLVENSHAEIIMPEEWPVAIGYGPWIAEIWTNYISNAIKYGGKPPRIELGSTFESPYTIRFWVRDNGAGIPTEKLPSLFQQFSRLGVTRIEGHGLGLSIVKRIAEKLGGDVGVESVVGEGSVFSFTLPSG